MIPTCYSRMDLLKQPCGAKMHNQIVSDAAFLSSDNENQHFLAGAIRREWGHESKLIPKYTDTKYQNSILPKQILDHSLLVSSSSFLCIRKAHCFF